MPNLEQEIENRTKSNIRAGNNVFTGDNTFSSPANKFVGDGSGLVNVPLDGVQEITTGVGLSGGPITTSGSIYITDTGVTPGTFTNAVVTVNAQGQVTRVVSGPPPSSTQTSYNYLLNSQFEFNDYTETDNASYSGLAVNTHAPTTNYFASRWTANVEAASWTVTRPDVAGDAGTAANYARRLSTSGASKIAIFQILPSTDSIRLQSTALFASLNIRGSYSGTFKIGIFKHLNSPNVILDDMVTAWGADGEDPAWNAVSLVDSDELTVRTTFNTLSAIATMPNTFKNVLVGVWSVNQLTAGQHVEITEGALCNSGTTYLIRSSAEERAACNYYARRFNFADETGLNGHGTSTTKAKGFVLAHPGMNLEYNSICNDVVMGSGSFSLTCGATNTAVSSFTTTKHDGITQLDANATGLTVGAAYRLTANTSTYITRCFEL